MTDNNSAQPTFNLPDQTYITPGSHGPDTDAKGLGEPWETVNFPDQLFIEAEELPVSSVPGWLATDTSPEATNTFAGNPQELITLIQDLNQCNDALLARVGELEEYLERSQTALQSELERSQSPTHQAGVGSASMAQLLQELDLANDGLRRATIHNQTLQAELTAGQQRIAQLEREFTLLQQRFSEKSAALLQAEENCRDLKSRLHRQQHYTLQFKAALEKCLNTDQNTSSPVPSTPAPSGVMPKSGQIRPWSALPGQAEKQSHLQSLFRSLKEREPLSQSLAPANPETTLAQSTTDPAIALTHQAPDLPVPVSVPPAVTICDPGPETNSEPWQIAATQPKTSGFTEPSPWGSPPSPTVTPVMADDQPSLAAVATAPRQTEQLTPAYPASLQQQPTIPATETKGSPSPLVYPLRSPKKIGSLAAVQLPSFGRHRSH